MSFVAGVTLTAAQLNAAFAAKFDAGAVSSYGATIVLAADAVTARGLLGLPAGIVNAANGTPQLDGSGKIPLSLLPSALQGALSWQGTWNASTNTPTLASGTGTKGYYYVVSVAGSTSLDGINVWNQGDWAVFNGTDWDKVDGVTSEVLSVAGRTGVVTIASTDLTDSTSAGRALVTAASVNVQRVALNIENWTTVNDANVALAAGKVTYTWTALTASRTATLLAASAYNPGQLIVLQDASGSPTPSMNITAVVNPTPGTDTISGSATVQTPFGRLELISDGVSKFYGSNLRSFGTGPGQAVFLDSSSRLPAVDGSLLTSVPALWPTGTLYGLTLSRASTTTFTVATGLCANDDGGTARNMTLASAFTKSLSAWAVGSGNGGLDTGAVAATTWYHVHLIRKDSDGSIDVLLSLSASAPTMPGGYTARRQIGSILTNGSSQIVNFIQNGDKFTWDLGVMDINVANPGTSAVTRTLSVPTGKKVDAIVDVSGLTAANFFYVLLTDLAQTDTTPSSSAYTVAAIDNSGTPLDTAEVRITTNTSAQIRSRLSASGAGDTLRIFTIGWIDTRGRY